MNNGSNLERWGGGGGGLFSSFLLDRAFQVYLVDNIHNVAAKI